MVCIKWYDNKSMMLLRSHLEEITSISTMQKRLKGSSSKIPLSFTTVKWVELTEWISCSQLDRRAKLRFYPCLLFDLFDVSLVNSFIVYNKLNNKDLILKKFKICIALKLIASFVSQNLFCPNHRPSKRTKAQRPDLILHHICQFSWGQNKNVCSQAEKENRQFAACSLCHVSFCLQKERNCFL